MGWLWHIAGLDTQNGTPYMFWSGIGGQITVALALLSAYHHANCHARWCPWIGKHKHQGTPYCRKHHPQPHWEDESGES